MLYVWVCVCVCVVQRTNIIYPLCGFVYTKSYFISWLTDLLFSTNFFFISRLVPHIITFLASQLTKEQHNLLLQYQGLVQKQIGLDREENTTSGEAHDNSSGVKVQLEEMLPRVKDVALAKKNPSVSSEWRIRSGRRFRREGETWKRWGITMRPEMI